MRDAFAGRGKGKLEASQVIIDELKKAIKLMPGFANSYHLMAQVYFSTGENLEEGERALNTAMQLDPQNKYFALTLAQLQIRKRAYDQAKKTLAPLLAPDDDWSLRAHAESIMGLIETYSAADAGTTGPPPADPQLDPQQWRQIPRRRLICDDGASQLRPAQAELTRIRLTLAPRWKARPTQAPGRP